MREKNVVEVGELDRQDEILDASGDHGSSGDKGSLCVRDLVRQYHTNVYAYAYRMTGRVQDAEDLTQQTFLIAQQHLGQLRSPDRAKGWLLAIARSQFCRMCRRKRPILANDAEIELAELPTANAGLPEIDEERVQQAIETMSESFRTVVLMYYMEQLSYREIAAELEIPIGTVMSRLARAKAQLRTAMGDEPE